MMSLRVDILNMVSSGTSEDVGAQRELIPELITFHSNTTVATKSKEKGDFLLRKLARNKPLQPTTVYKRKVLQFYQCLCGLSPSSIV